MTRTVIALPCTDSEAAQRFETWLRNEGVDVNGTDGHKVLVPTTNPLFIWDLAEAAVENGFAHDDEVCKTVGEFLYPANISVSGDSLASGQKQGSGLT